MKKELPKIELNFRGTKISKSLETVEQFQKCLEFLYREESNLHQVTPCPCCAGTGVASNA